MSERPAARRAPGFTLLELIVVMAIIALASSVASLALRDPAATRLEREGQRLILLLEAGRAQSRALGVPITWEPVSRGAAPASRVPGSGEAVDPTADFRFVGLPNLGRDAALPTHFLDAQTDDSRVVIDLPSRQTGIVLGPEPLIGAQSLILRLGERRLTLATDGLGPFVEVPE